MSYNLGFCVALPVVRAPFTPFQGVNFSDEVDPTDRQILVRLPERYIRQSKLSPGVICFILRWMRNIVSKTQARKRIPNALGFKPHCVLLILTLDSSGAVDSVWPFAFGRFLAGVGGSGMTDLLSVLINGEHFF